jgi:hypothetical protein
MDINYELINLKERIIILENEMNLYKLNKIFIAIYDLIINDHLDFKYNFLYNIKKYKCNINHSYINKEFDININIINYKKLLLKNKLLNLTSNEKEIFSKKYNINNLINFILDYLNILEFNIDNLNKDDKIDADNWWLY